MKVELHFASAQVSKLNETQIILVKDVHVLAFNDILALRGNGQFSRK